MIVANKPDSQEICFVPDKDYAGFIERYTGKKAEPGQFVDENGTVLGTHKGIAHYTIGQRKGPWCLIWRTNVCYQNKCRAESNCIG